MSLRFVLVIVLLGVLCSCDSGSKIEVPAQNEQTVSETPEVKPGIPAEQQAAAVEQSTPIDSEAKEEFQGDPLSIQLETQDRDPMELVMKISETSVEELSTLSFLELNLLKNAVYAAKGYRFADDKVWLKEYFCGDLFAEQHFYFSAEALESVPAKTPEEDQSDDHYDIHNVRNALGNKKLALRQWKKSLPAPQLFDLSQYKFPGCSKSGEIDEQQKLAAANVRIAIIKKVAGISGNLERVIAGTSLPETENTFYALGKLFPSGRYGEYDETGDGDYNYYSGNWIMSLKRELMGINQLVKLMNRIEDFDQMELLGLYAGDIALLKNIIEAKYGKPFQGVPGWEVSRLIGVTDVDPNYDPTKLPVEVQVRIQMLEETINKILHSDLSDVPKELRDGNIKIAEWYPAAC